MPRPKEFDVNEVLLKAMKLFWQQGYEKTSINDLVEHLGIHRRSLYDTFGDKHQLFLQAVEVYRNFVSGRLEKIINAPSARQGLRTLFDFIIDGMEDKPPGCLVVNMSVELALRDPEVDAKARESFERTEGLITDLIRKGQENGEFTNMRDAGELAAHLHSTMLGLRVLVRTSADQKKLHRIAETALALLEV
ncbi:TetR/AcrR family transcriptional regulator [Paenibacillus gansuensis]|uniref:TetR/AcrR family transcriptional regulator n=1 Tax=Paenibacillus gansuensis TaxID=306542 RepID=A0ABW5PEX4_9BACL